MTPLSPELSEKRDLLLARLSDFERVAVAFSGGVDSSLVAKAAQIACGDRAVALTAISPSLAGGELEIAAQVASTIGIRHELVPTEEFENPDYVKNAPNRCFFCKDELYSQLERLQSQFGFEAVLNGANLDDRGDHRPGMQAAKNHQVDSPLLETGFTKQDVRDLAQHWELPVWDKPASPCLSSRIAYGIEVTPELVRRVDAAEQFLKKRLNLTELRVRHMENGLARIEVPSPALPVLREPNVIEEVTTYFKSLGFQSVTVDLEGFRSGSLNDVIPLDQLQKL
ncbi:MAG: ATP-dependent sacrificial sulfur transferase LarE [Planctomycetaceae bacterium]|jgi:pyridinium-3,5-biscarboxylic acid mononucleotide sulfurtransferase|nr:ATP-dependent sacrificial sulfur transferase LarE [Planctomycetaceae bacterium]MDG2391066.1 ATP-dependent sacrificial sulfur transferase LarE [Planctomycetaceae bacterium]